MNYPAASSGVASCWQRTVSDSNFTKSIAFLFEVGDLAGRSMAAGATGASENIPSPHHRTKAPVK